MQGRGQSKGDICPEVAGLRLLGYWLLFRARISQARSCGGMPPFFAQEIRFTGGADTSSNLPTRCITRSWRCFVRALGSLTTAGILVGASHRPRGRQRWLFLERSLHAREARDRRDRVRIHHARLRTVVQRTALAICVASRPLGNGMTVPLSSVNCGPLARQRARSSRWPGCNASLHMFGAGAGPDVAAGACSRTGSL